jgi:diguanylate cyclase
MTGQALQCSRLFNRIISHAFVLGAFDMLLNRAAVSASVAVAYVLAGWLSLQMTVPPYYVSLVFLPAGVALGAALVFGWPGLVGVALGAVGVHWMAHDLAGLTQWPWTMLVSPAAAALQAGATAWAVRRWVGYPGEFDNTRRTMLFLLVLVPVGQLPNATVSVPLLVDSGVISAADGWFNWGIWWQGDTLGALLLTPLVLVIFGQPAQAWRPRLKTVALPMLAALAVVGTAFFYIQRTEQENLAQRFEQESSLMTERLQRRLHAQTDAVMAVTRLMEVVGGSDPDEFRLATSIWLQRYGGTQNFGWSPLVRHPDRERFERSAGANLGGHYTIKGRRPTGETYTAPAAERYLPIRFVEPLETNRSVLGLDVLVLPATANAANRALASRLPQVTEAIRLVQESGDQRGVVLYQAARYPQVDGGPVAPTPLLGVVSAVFRMDDVLQAALEGDELTYLGVCLLDPAAAASNQRLAGAPGCGGHDATTARFFSSRTVEFGGRSWLFQVSSGPTFERRTRGWTAWGVLTVSLVAVAMLGLFLLVITGHARRTEHLVDERTAELARSNAVLQELAHFDPLTGLPNRAHWMQEARAALETARHEGDRLAVLFVDLDNFKDVNDAMGHGVGDLLLKAVALRLKGCLRARDVLARQGGDEFVVLLPWLKNPEAAAAVATKMVEVLTEPFRLQGQDVRVSASVGMDWFDGSPDTDVETLLRHADMAMYMAKTAGRNGWRSFLPEMDQSVSQRLMVESGLRRALSGNELVLHYQPQVEAGSGRVTGVEALVRWQHPELGLLMPDRFVPNAESSGQIEALGSWVLRAACHQFVEWRDQGMGDIDMAVNVSAVEFSRPGFVARVREVLADTGMDPHRLELEITETALMQSLPDLVARLGDISAMGVRLALDDFGTGYSSLSYLKRLPLHRVKIDRSFVNDLPGDKEGAAIVRATLSMAHALGLQVVAEGVELREQHDFLRAAGCDHIQGWLVSRPMAPAAFEAWWRQRMGPSRAVVSG